MPDHFASTFALRQGGGLACRIRFILLEFDDPLNHVRVAHFLRNDRVNSRSIDQHLETIQRSQIGSEKGLAVRPVLNSLPSDVVIRTTPHRSDVRLFAESILHWKDEG